MCLLNMSTRKKKSRKTTARRRMVCAPGVKRVNGSCLSDLAIHDIAKAWNKRHPDRPSLSGNADQLRAGLSAALDHACSNERCWLRKAFAKNKIPSILGRYTFAPAAPASWRRNPHEWLDSLDIERVMKQYERAYPGFSFIGPSPIDFDKRLHNGRCVWEELCNFDLKKSLRAGKRFVGIIFNLDPHTKGGSHWISMFIHVPDGYILAFDSTGDPMPPQVDQLIKRVVQQAAALDIKLRVIRSSKEHQLEDTECGIYSLYVISGLLDGTLDPKRLSQGPRISDDQMFRLRETFFNV